MSAQAFIMSAKILERSLPVSDIPYFPIEWLKVKPIAKKWKEKLKKSYLECSHTTR